MIGNILGNLYVITIGIDVATEMGSLDGYFDGCTDSKLEGILIGG